MSAQNDADGGFLWLIIIYAGLAWYFGWWPLNDTERAIERSRFNVYFFYSDGNKSAYLGEADGLQACGDVAKAYSQHWPNGEGAWSYVCCRVTSDSSCATKHR